MFLRALQLLLLSVLVALRATAAQDAKAQWSRLADSTTKLIRQNAANGPFDACQNENLIVRKEWYVRDSLH